MSWSPVGLQLLGVYPCRGQRGGCQNSYESFHFAKEEFEGENDLRDAKKDYGERKFFGEGCLGDGGGGWIFFGWGLVLL